MKVLHNGLLAATVAVIGGAAIAVSTLPLHAQGKSGDSSGAAGAAGGGHGAAAAAGGNPGGASADAASSGGGSLSASNAAPQAIENADANSVPGSLRSYRDSVVAGDWAAAADALQAASNKQVTVEDIRMVNERLNIEPMDEAQEQALLDELD